MSHTTSLRRTASALGAAALLGTVLAAPAMAAQDPGTGGRSADSSSATSATDSSWGLDRSRRDGGMTYPEATAKTNESAPVIVYVEDHTVEYLQVAAGLLAGATIAGAGAVAISRRREGGLQPA